MSLIIISELFEYVGDVVSKYIKGKNVYTVKHIIYCGMTRYDKNVVEDILQTSDLFGIPIELHIKINANVQSINLRIFLFLLFSNILKRLFRQTN